MVVRCVVVFIHIVPIIYPARLRPSGKKTKLIPSWCDNNGGRTWTPEQNINNYSDEQFIYQDGK